MGDHVAVVPGRADVVALERRPCRGRTISANFACAVQNGSCTTMVSGTAPCLDQAVDVLVVVEGIPAGPVHQSDVRVGEAPAVIVDTAAGIEQHVGDPGDRNIGLDRILTLGQARSGETPVRRRRSGAWSSIRRQSAPPGVPICPSSAASPVAAQKGCSPCSRALQRPGDIDHGAMPRHAASEGSDLRGGDLGQGFSPGRSLRVAIADTQDVIAPGVEADCVTLDEIAIEQPSVIRTCARASMSAVIAAGPERPPFRIGDTAEIAAKRADIDELDAGLAQFAQSVRTTWRPTPPAPTCAFLVGRPPKATNSSQCFSKWESEVCSASR